MGEHISPEHPEAASPGGLSSQERESISLLADARRRGSEFKQALLKLEAPEGEALQDRHNRVRGLVMQESERTQPAAVESTETYDTLTQEADRVTDFAPNLAALKYARAAEVQEAAGADTRAALDRAKEASRRSAELPRLTPASLLPDAILLATEKRLLKDRTLPTPDVVANAAIGDQRLLEEYALVLPEKDRAKFMTALPLEKREAVSARLDREVSSVLREGTVAEETELAQSKAVRGRIAKELSSALEQPASKSHEAVRLLNQALYALGDKESRDLVLQLARKPLREGKVAGKHVPRVFHTLLGLNTDKGNSLAIELLGRPELPDHVGWLFTKKLVENGYLDPNLKGLLAEKRRFWARLPTKERAAKEKEYLGVSKLIISKLRINPDAEVIKLITERSWQDKNGARINEPERIVDRIQEKRAEFDAITDKDQLISRLAGNQELATIYYSLYGGKTRYALVNSYNSEKFRTILQLVDSLKIHEATLRTFSESLAGAGFSKAEAQGVIEQLRAGHFPLGGSFAREVRLDVSDTGRLETLQRQAQKTFGKDELGLLIKTEFYGRRLEANPDQQARELLAALDESAGLAEAEAIVQKIEQAYPDLLTTLEQDKNLTKKWSKLGEKNIFSLSLHSVVAESENNVNLREVITKLEQERKSLLSQFRQKSRGVLKKLADPKVREEEKQKLQEQIAMIEDKGAHKLLGYLIADTAASKYDETGIIREPTLSPITDKLAREWESHVEQLFGEYQALEAQPRPGKKERIVTLRYIDKRADLIESLRFADAAQCCFTSTQYRIEGNTVGNAEWISRLHKDPLSFMFQIEDNAPGAERRAAVGFVFGSFGVEERKPVVLLNGVYLEGKTDTAAQSIARSIEDSFSRPLKAERQYVAARYGGSTNYGTEYSNSQRTLTRLRAITSQSGSGAETQIYDDLLPIGLNAPGRTDTQIYSKKL